MLSLNLNKRGYFTQYKEKVGDGMTRKNEKEQLINYENSYKQSNEFSMAKLNHGLSLNQMQLLAFTIFCTQSKGVNEFNKADFEEKFNTDYKTIYAKEDVPILARLQAELISVVDMDKEVVDYSFVTVFKRIRYEKGLFTFNWADEILPHILELKEKYITTDLTITAKFKSGFSWRLYEYLKGHYGYWHKVISKEDLMQLFNVEDKKTYQKNTGDFKKTVLDVAISEINEHTELEVCYKEIKTGRAITGFDLIWTTGEKVKSATKKQIDELKAYIDVVFEDMFKYVNLNDQENREDAIELVRRLEAMKDHLSEPISITMKYADRLIKDARWILNELEGFLQTDQKTIKNPGYEWLGKS